MPFRFPVRRGAAAFSLIELLAAITIVLILSGLVSTYIKHSRQSAREVLDMANLRQLGTGMMLYLAENQGQFPTAYGHSDNGWKGPYWSDQIADYIPVKHRERTTGRNPAFYSPLFENNHYIAGYGANSFVVNAHFMSEGKPQPVHLSNIPQPGRTVLIANNGSYRNGILTGVWLLNGYGVLSSPRADENAPADGVPWPIHRGKFIAAAFCDGHIDLIPYETYLDDPAAYFGRVPFR